MLANIRASLDALTLLKNNNTSVITLPRGTKIFRGQDQEVEPSIASHWTTDKKHAQAYSRGYLYERNLITDLNFVSIPNFIGEFVKKRYGKGISNVETAEEACSQLRKLFKQKPAEFTDISGIIDTDAVFETNTGGSQNYQKILVLSYRDMLPNLG
jgi:hypothetical protein